MTTDTANNAAAKPDAEGLRRTLEDAIHAYDKTISEWETAVKPPDDIMTSIRDFLKITLTREGAVALLNYVARLENERDALQQDYENAQIAVRELYHLTNGHMNIYTFAETAKRIIHDIMYRMSTKVIEHQRSRAALAPQAEAAASDHATDEG